MKSKLALAALDFYDTDDNDDWNWNGKKWARA